MVLAQHTARRSQTPLALAVEGEQQALQMRRGHGQLSCKHRRWQIITTTMEDIPVHCCFLFCFLFLPFEFGCHHFVSSFVTLQLTFLGSICACFGVQLLCIIDGEAGRPIHRACSGLCAPGHFCH